MIPLQWRSAVRKLHISTPQLTSRIRSCNVVSRSFQTRTARARERVPTPQSRVLNRCPPPFTRQNGSAIQRLFVDPSVLLESSAQGRILYSAFPTKTVIFLLVVGAVAYYFIDVRYPDWTDAALENYGSDPGATPLHFYQNLDELNHWLDFHVPDPGALMRDPQFAQMLCEQFDRLVFGWMMSEDEAKNAYMPMTHGCQYKSNEPCEDFFALGTSPGPGTKPWNYWAVFDGHAGRHTAFYLQWTLIPHLSLALSKLSPSSSSPIIETTIKDTFLKIDEDLMARGRHAANWFPAANAAAIGALTPVFSGSCALLATFDPERDTLRVACTGDSRAVLGRWDPVEEKYVCKPLSVDQTGFNKDEVDRLTAAHPEEPDIIDPRSGRLLGIAVTRAFGDHRWKWDNDFIKQLQVKFWGSGPRPGSETPPYMTAEPVITETQVVRANAQSKLARGERSDFMIMASDGLWDRMSSEHAVECVSRWLDARDRGNGTVANDPHREPLNFGKGFQADPDVDFNVETGELINWKATPEHFAIEDENAAVCLTRNAMGGTRRNLFLGIVSVAGPMSRYAVDDTTVMVVFFDKVDSTGAGKMVEKRKNPWWWPW